MGQLIAARPETEGLSSVLVDGSGLGNVDSDKLKEHTIKDEEMWLAQTDEVKDGLVFEFDQPRMLGTISVWNYNKPAYTDLGAQKADISVWTNQDGWKTIVSGANFEEAEGSNDYDEPTIITFKPVIAEKVRFDSLAAFNTELKQVGLSEVRFNEPLGPNACNPDPGQDAYVRGTNGVELEWTAGKDSVVHDVYVGEAEGKLALLGRVKGQPKVTIDGLAAENRYQWRIDEVTKDGTVTAGPVWSFRVGGHEVAYWKLDGNAKDSLGEFDGTVKGEPIWQEGHDGQAIVLDGVKDYVEIPAMNLNTRELTICAWINLDEFIYVSEGIAFYRSGHTVAGLNIKNEVIRYHWNDLDETWGFDSGLTVPKGRWVFAAVSVMPEAATLYLYDEGKMLTAVNNISHGVEEFDGTGCIGWDPHEDERKFKGMIDEVRIFDFALNATQIGQVCEGLDVEANRDSNVRLVNANLVGESESLKKIAEESIEAESGEKGNNLIAVAVIIIAIGCFAVISFTRKKK